MRKAIFAGAVVLVLGIGAVALADHGSHRFKAGHLGQGEGILEEVLSELVSEGSLAQVQSDLIMAALQEKKESLEAARAEAKELLESFWEDDVLTEDEISQLPFAEQILAKDGVAEALADGQITRQEWGDLRGESKFGHGKKGSRGGGKR